MLRTRIDSTDKIFCILRFSSNTKTEKEERTARTQGDPSKDQTVLKEAPKKSHPRESQTNGSSQEWGGAMTSYGNDLHPKTLSPRTEDREIFSCDKGVEDRRHQRLLVGRQ